MKISLSVLCLLPGLVVGAPAADNPDVMTVLARMDQAAGGFKGMAADVEMQQYTKLLDDTTTQNGTVKMQRSKGAEIRAILEFPGEQTLAFSGRNLVIYYPKLGEYQMYPASKLGTALNQFLLLGFGSSGRELRASYEISADGAEKIGDKSTVKLVLTPKDAKVAAKLPKAELWIPTDQGYPVRQQFWEPTSGNYRLLTYSKVQINPPMTGTLDFKPPSSAKKQSK